MQIDRAHALGITGRIQKTNKKFGNILEKLSTGKKINRASDDASGLAVAEILSANVRGFQMGNVNANYAQAAQYIAEGAGNETSSILQRQRELAIQSSNDTLSPSNRQALDTEFQALNEELTRIADSSEFNGLNVANGTELGAGGGEVMVGPQAGDLADVVGADFTASNLGTVGEDILSSAGASSALAAIDTAIASTNNQRVAIGANINRLEHTISNNTNQAINTKITMIVNAVQKPIGLNNKSDMMVFSVVV